MSSSPIRVMIADDHPIVREAMKSILANCDILVVAEAKSGPETLEILERIDCDLLILDMAMPGSPVGPDLIETITQGRNPPPILVFSMSDDERTASAALQMGASGYLTKSSAPHILLDAVQKIAAKGKYVCPDVAEKILFGGNQQSAHEPPHKQLSNREHQIFLMILDGKSMDTIASELSISRQTVGTHKMRLMHKLGLQNTVDIVRYAIHHGLMQM